MALQYSTLYYGARTVELDEQISRVLSACFFTSCFRSKIQHRSAEHVRRVRSAVSQAPRERATSIAMEKHHKLRRPAGSSIHGCNICGIEGHQAAQCPNGTVNWAQKWGPNAFQSSSSGGLSSGTTSEPNYADLAAQARAFAAKRLADEEAAKKKAEEVRAECPSAHLLRNTRTPFPLSPFLLGLSPPTFSSLCDIFVSRQISLDVSWLTRTASRTPSPPYSCFRYRSTDMNVLLGYLSLARARVFVLAGW